MGEITKKISGRYNTSNSTKHVVWIRSAGHCELCGADLIHDCSDGVAVRWDDVAHILPASPQGLRAREEHDEVLTNDIDNLMLLCLGCYDKVDCDADGYPEDDLSKLHQEYRARIQLAATTPNDGRTPPILVQKQHVETNNEISERDLLNVVRREEKTPKINPKRECDPIAVCKSLLELSQDFIQHTLVKIDPVPGRMAVITSQRWCEGKQGYPERIHQLATYFQAGGWDLRCMVGPLACGNEPLGEGCEVIRGGVRYLYGPSRVKTDSLPSVESVFGFCVEVFLDWFNTYKPQVVLAADDFTSALPAIVAARQLSIPVIKEKLHYAEAFQSYRPHELFSDFDFSQQFAVEQACLRLADASYYLYPDDESSWLTLQEVITQVCGLEHQEQSLAILKSKAHYTIKYPVQGEGLYYLELKVRDVVSGNPKGVVASFRFMGPEGNLLPLSLPDFLSSKKYPQYRYVNTSVAHDTYQLVIFELPVGVSQLEVDIVAFVTQEELQLQHLRIGKTSLVDVARWLSIKAHGIRWVKAVETFAHKEGAASLHLALLDYKYKLSKYPNAERQLKGAIQEMVELDWLWVPELLGSHKKLSLKATNRLTVAHLHKTACPYENTEEAIRCLNTVLSQQRLGMDPYIITPIGYPCSVGVENALNHEVIEGIEHFRIGANTRGLPALSLPDRNRYSVFHIAKLFKQRGVNVIHAASGMRGYELALQAVALKKLTGVPFLYEVGLFHEHISSPEDNDVIERERTQLQVMKENFCMSEADVVTTISFSMKKILIERGVEPEKIEVIPNAIDENKYLDKVFTPIFIPALDGAEMVVGYISNMSCREGLQYLIKAIYKLRDKTGRDIRGLFVGNGPERGNLERLTKRLGMEELIVFTGEVDHSRMSSYYKTIDIFVIPRIPDYSADWAAPLAPYEAMALERPIIASDLPVLREIVGEEGERGLLAKPADVDSLIEQLQRYIDDPELRQSKVNAAKKWVFSEHTWSVNAKRYDAIYQRLMAGNVSGKWHA